MLFLLMSRLRGHSLVPQDSEAQKLRNPNLKQPVHKKTLESAESLDVSNETPLLSSKLPTDSAIFTPIKFSKFFVLLENIHSIT
ncbi:hypothetical protein CCB80_01745 [Armatimonadetes bacterium Uphvl-Ar1]|nr:hypothetical protein CCB80_01745 [Armatimonadetes bacterium Uphvl-Ar1]